MRLSASATLLALFFASPLGAQPVDDTLFEGLGLTLPAQGIHPMDRKPLQGERFVPPGASPDRVAGVRLLSTGLIFPIRYDVVAIRGAQPGVLDTLAAAQSKQPGVVVQTIEACSGAPRCLLFTQRLETAESKPDAVAANALFVRNQTLYHFSATQFGPRVMRRAAWGAPGPDPIAREHLEALLRAATFDETTPAE